MEQRHCLKLCNWPALQLLHTVLQMRLVWLNTAN